MYKLEIGTTKYIRVRNGQTAERITQVYHTPCDSQVYVGQIIPIKQDQYILYEVDVGESYATIAQKFGTTQEELLSLNGQRAIYPTVNIVVPKGHSF